MACIFLCFSACNNVAPAKEHEPPVSELIVIKSDTLQVQAAIADFLRWYKANYNKATAFPILTKDSVGNFMVSKTGYTGFLHFLSSSRLIAPQYIGLWQTYFKDKETELTQNPSKTETPEGFDFDFVLITAQPQILLNKIDSIRYEITSMSDSAALVGVRWPDGSLAEYEFEMFKGNEGWQIGYISTPNYD